jgi:hypothetical protein
MSTFTRNAEISATVVIEQAFSKWGQPNGYILGQKKERPARSRPF